MAIMWDDTPVNYPGEAPSAANGWQQTQRQVREFMCVKGFCSDHRASQAEYLPTWAAWEGRVRIDERARNLCAQMLAQERANGGV